MKDKETFEKLREKFIELGDNTTEKSYFPHIQDKLLRLQKFRELIDHAGIGIFMVRLPTYEITDVNQAASNLVYFEEKKLLKTSFKTLIEPKFFDFLQSLFENFSTKTTTKRAVLKTRLGFNIAVEMNIQLATYDDIFYHIIMVRDLASIAKPDAEQVTDETTFKHIFNSTHDSIIVHDARGRIIEVNNTTLDMYELPRELVMEYGMSDLSANPIQIENIPEILRMVNAGKDLVFEWLARRPLSGRTFDVEVSLRKITWKGYDSIIAVVRDITERKRHEIQLKANEERYRKILDTITDYIFTVEIENAKAVRTHHNPACEAVTGYSQYELDSNPFLWMQMIHADDVQRVTDRVNSIMKGENVGAYEHRITRKDGQERWIMNTPVIHLDERGVLTSYDGIIKDITERKRVELYMIQNEEKYKTLFHKLNDAIIHIDNGLIVDCNHNAEQMFGVNKVNMISKPVSMLMPTGSDGDILQKKAFDENITNALAGIPVFFEYTFKKAGGEDIYTDINVGLLENTTLQLIIKDITQKIIDEKRIAEMNEFNSLVINSIDALVLVLDKDLKVISFNKSCQALTGIAQQDAVGRYLWDVATEESDRETIKHSIQLKIRQGGHFSLEYFWLTADKGKRWIAWNNATVTNERGGVTNVICSGIDVSESRWFMESLGSVTANAISKTGSDFFNETSRQLVELLGADCIMIGKYENDYQDVKSLSHIKDKQMLPASVLPTHNSPYATIVEAQMLVSQEHIATLYPNDKFITHNKYESFVGIPLFNSQNTLLGLVSIFYKTPFPNRHVVESVAKIFGIRIASEIERLQYEETLLMSSQLLELSNNLSNMGYCYVNASGTILWSKQMFAIFDVSGIQEPLGFSEIAAMAIDEHRGAFTAFMASDGSQQALEFTVVSKAGTVKHLYAMVDTIKDHRKRMNTKMWIFRDITSWKDAEQDREKLVTALEKKNKELESVLYIASHDLRSPLVNAQGFGSLLEVIKGELRARIEETVMGSSDKEAILSILDERISMPIKFINSSCYKMDTLIQGLLRLSRTGITPIEVAQLDMNGMLESIVQTLTMQIQKSGTKVDIAQLPSCVGDEMQINQLFTNLIDNAIKYRDPGRQLTISVRGDADAEMATYQVADTGKGIPDYQLDKIWKLFHRCDPEGEVTGEGLGLTIAKRIAERQGGSITAESELNRGTTFTITIPRKRQ